MKKSVLVALLVTFTLCESFTTAFASTFSARIERDMIDVKISSTISQNITSLFEKRISVTGDSLTNATRAFEKQIKARSPEAMIKNLSVQCVFTNSTVEVSVRFNVFGVILGRKEVVSANLTWRGFSILDDLSAENVSYNLVGRAYFLGIIPHFENMTGARFYENRTLPATVYRAKDIAGNTTMLRFKSLEAPLSKWQMVYNITKAETSYSLKLERTVDLAVRRELNASVTAFGMWMDLSGEITAPGYARLNGDLVVYEAGVGISETLMIASTTISLLVAVAAHTIERKKTRTKTEAKRK